MRAYRVWLASEVAQRPVLFALACRSCAIWQILNEDDKDGGSCRWEGRFRIRHVATGTFLSVQLARSADYFVRLVECARADEPELLFRFEPLCTRAPVHEHAANTAGKRGRQTRAANPACAH